jgi:acetylornithine deacetylase/succinyl-diaminopimelate desuccinylase family protein
MAALLCTLISVPTENPPGNHYARCADLLHRTITTLGFPCTRTPCAPDADAVVATLGSGPRAFHFHGHYDVVPAQSPTQFAATRKNHFVFGRGSADMKGGIVAMLYAMLALRELGHAPLAGRIVLTLVPDEETGGLRGSQQLARKKLLGQDSVGMLLAEPTSGVIWNANRGAISLKVRVKGKSAHVGLQHQGDNAFEKMAIVLARLQTLKRQVEKRRTKLPLGVSSSAKARHSILMLGGESGGGTNFNVVPAEAWFTIDRRINPEEDLTAETERILAVLESCKADGISLTYEMFQEGNSSASPLTHTVAQSLSRNIARVTGKKPKFEMCPGLLETRFYAAERISAYAYGPGLLSVAHGPNEYVDLRRMIDCAAIYALTAQQVLSAPSLQPPKAC